MIDTGPAMTGTYVKSDGGVSDAPYVLSVPAKFVVPAVNAVRPAPDPPPEYDTVAPSVRMSL